MRTVRAHIPSRLASHLTSCYSTRHTAEHHIPPIAMMSVDAALSGGKQRPYVTKSAATQQEKEK